MVFDMGTGASKVPPMLGTKRGTSPSKKKVELADPMREYEKKQEKALSDLEHYKKMIDRVINVDEE
jgi:hypothetical protein